MNMQQINEKYGEALTDYLLEIMHDTPVSDLIDEVLSRMGDDELDNIMQDLRKELYHENFYC